jgi:hypothetical protein
VQQDTPGATPRQPCAHGQRPRFIQRAALTTKTLAALLEELRYDSDNARAWDAAQAAVTAISSDLDTIAPDGVGEVEQPAC